MPQASLGVIKPSNIQLLLLETQIPRSSSMDSILLPPLVFQQEKICSWFLNFGTKLFEVSWGVAGREAGLAQDKNELILALAIELLVGICKHLGGQERALVPPPSLPFAQRIKSAQIS